MTDTTESTVRQSDPAKLAAYRVSISRLRFRVLDLCESVEATAVAGKDWDPEGTQVDPVAEQMVADMQNLLHQMALRHAGFATFLQAALFGHQAAGESTGQVGDVPAGEGG